MEIATNITMFLLVVVGCVEFAQNIYDGITGTDLAARKQNFRVALTILVAGVMGAILAKYVGYSAIAGAYYGLGAAGGVTAIKKASD